jgi:antirestriction protein ArdC
MQKDVYAQVTAAIVAELEKGERPWMKPWNAAHAAGSITRPLRYNGLPYSGINVLMLWMAAMEKGYSAPIWMTYRQAVELGGHVRKGEKGSLVVYANAITRTERDEETGEDKEKKIPFMKGYTAFNVEQIAELPPHYYAKAVMPRLEDSLRLQNAELFIRHTGATVRYGGDRAYYAIGSDHVQMPPFESFRDPESFYGTLLHEAVHWTRHASRLDRDLGRQRWGDEGYAREELVAELGSAFLCADLGITPEVRADHAAYIGNWLKILKDEKRFIFSAAAQAQRAVEYLHQLQPEYAPERGPGSAGEGERGQLVP